MFVSVLCLQEITHFRANIKYSPKKLWYIAFMVGGAVGLKLKPINNIVSSDSLLTRISRKTYVLHVVKLHVLLSLPSGA